MIELNYKKGKEFDMNKYMQQRYHEMQELGLCPVCGKPKQDKSKSKCNSCMEKAKEVDRRYYEKNKSKRLEKTKSRYRRLKEQGLCTACGKVKTKNALCDTCKAKYRGGKK